MKRQNDAGLHHVFKRMLELLWTVAIGGHLPNDKKMIDRMLKRKYIRKHTFDGKNYYYITEKGRQLLQNSKKDLDITVSIGS